MMRTILAPSAFILGSPVHLVQVMEKSSRTSFPSWQWRTRRRLHTLRPHPGPGETRQTRIGYIMQILPV